MKKYTVVDHLDTVLTNWCNEHHIQVNIIDEKYLEFIGSEKDLKELHDNFYEDCTFELTK